MQALIKAGASRAEITEALAMAVYMGGGPSVMYAAEAMSAYDELSVPQAGTTTAAAQAG
jgi:alkylhydroperoxidase/carboxymuconolactone decarboxylase family protein YurZ